MQVPVATDKYNFATLHKYCKNKMVSFEIIVKLHVEYTDFFKF